MSDSEGDWEEEEQLPLPCPCLFCTEECRSGESMVEHCCDTHQIDLVKLRRKLGLGFYGWVQLINYIRKEKPSTASLLISTPPYAWEHELYLIPTLSDDPVLQLDIDLEAESNLSLEEKEEEEEEKVTVKVNKMPSIMSNNAVGEDVVLLKKRLLDTQTELEQTKQLFQQAMIDLNEMRRAVADIMSENKAVTVQSKEPKENEEDNYFSTYSHFAIHEEMLKDHIRMEAYHLFITKNEEIFKDKVVLDVGCGSGILSMLAVRSGARQVIAVDASSIIYKAIEIARENGVDNCIRFIHGMVEDLVLEDKVDVIVSEWMGYFLLFESMMDTVLYARDKWLKDHTQVYPNRCNMNLVAISDEYEYNNKIKFWDDVEGFKMSAIKADVIREAYVMEVDEYSLISTSDVIKKFDLTRVKQSQLNFEASFTLTMQRNAQCHALVGYFDVSFEVPNYRVYFSTSPQDTPTHWKQTVFFLKEPIAVATGDMLRGKFSCCKNQEDPRTLDIHIDMKLLTLVPGNEDPFVLKQSFALC